jgi:tetrahydromethanopterin S-methyltransferase subunit F
MSTIDAAAELLVREWLKLFRKAPNVTVVGTIFSIAVGIAGVYVADQVTKQEREEKRMQNLTYAKQAQKLDETRANIQALLEFVEDEKKQLQISQQVVQSLKAEHEKLKPIVDSDRKTIDALFSAQEARNQAALSSERWIGFIMGVVSSLVASLVWSIGMYLVRRRKSVDTSNPVAPYGSLSARNNAPNARTIPPCKSGSML